MIHIFNDGHADGGDTTLVRPSNWNDVHVHAVRAISANTSGALTDDWIQATGGAGGITYTLPSPSTKAGIPIRIQKVDSAAGVITINPNATEKINALNNLNQSSYVLTNAGQF